MFRAIETCLTALRVRYAEPHRAYHTQAHVDAMLAGLQELGEMIVHPAAVELAIWYHDAVYDPAAADNEARSADLLRAELDNLAALFCWITPNCWYPHLAERVSPIGHPSGQWRPRSLDADRCAIAAHHR